MPDRQDNGRREYTAPAPAPPRDHIPGERWHSQAERDAALAALRAARRDRRRQAAWGRRQAQQERQAVRPARPKRGQDGPVTIRRPDGTTDTQPAYSAKRVAEIRRQGREAKQARQRRR